MTETEAPHSTSPVGMPISTIWLGAMILTAALAFFPGALAATEKPETEKVPETFGHSVAAVVDGENIDWQEYGTALRQAARQKFYHGQIPQEKIAELRVEIIEELVDRKLLLKEAGRRGIEADEEAVARGLEAMSSQKKDDPKWMEQWNRVVHLIRAKMLDDSILVQLERAVRKVDEPTPIQLRKFYDNNIVLFTEPIQERVAVILLGVDPSAPKSAWEAAKSEADKIAERINRGAEFAELAKLHSSDGSAADGGDMGYLHRGMLATPAQDAVDKLSLDEITPPVELLQGYALFKLLDRSEPDVKQFGEVQDRVKALYLRTTSENRWNELKADLRRVADVSVNPAIYISTSKEAAPVKQ